MTFFSGSSLDCFGHPRDIFPECLREQQEFDIKNKRQWPSKWAKQIHLACHVDASLVTEKSQLTCHKARTTTALQGLIVSMANNQ